MPDDQVLPTEDQFSVDSARAASERDELEQWVSEFLRSPGSDNAALADLLSSPRRWWLGPVRLPFVELHRLAGPPDAPALAPLDDDDLERVDEMEESLDEGWDPPPLIVSFRDGQLVVEDGNHRIEGLRRAGRSDGWSLICFEDADDRANFVQTPGPVC